MVMTRRSFRRKYLRPRLTLLTLALLIIFDALFIAAHNPPAIRTSTLPTHLQNEKIFIASMHRDSEYILRLYWNGALLRLVEKLGPSNVFVSILESGSSDRTKESLQELESQLNDLGVENRISLGINGTERIEYLSHVPAEGQERTGWLFTGRGESGWEMRRIPHLARLRNQVMVPLLQREKDGEPRFDRVLWVNDVVFTPEDVLTLLSTRSGSYASACALDFGSNPTQYYDTFALRDAYGLKTATLTYPYFHSSASLNPLYSLSPIPVQSCWNGIISMTADPFYPTSSKNDNSHNSKNGNDDNEHSSIPLTFRAVADSLATQHIEGSECCLIHSDNPLRSTLGNWLNPNVRVSYHPAVYSQINQGALLKSDIQDEVYGVAGGDGSAWPGKRERVMGVWKNRLVRATGWGKIRTESWWARSQVERWVREEKEEEREEVGLECLINEMQVMVWNGWKHL